MITQDQAWRIAEAAYEAGWRDACDDHLQQEADARHAIGTRKRAGVLLRLDPNGLDAQRTQKPRDPDEPREPRPVPR